MMVVGCYIYIYKIGKILDIYFHTRKMTEFPTEIFLLASLHRDLFPSVDGCRSDKDDAISGNKYLLTKTCMVVVSISASSQFQVLVYTVQLLH